MQQKKKELAMQLSEKAVSAIFNALDLIEQGGSVQEAKSELREIGRKLTEIQFEFRGGCRW